MVPALSVALAYTCTQGFKNKTQMENCGFYLVIPQSHREAVGLHKPCPLASTLEWQGPALERALEEMESLHSAPCSCCGVPICPQVKSVRRRDKKASVLFIEGNMNPKGRGLVMP